MKSNIVCPKCGADILRLTLKKLECVNCGANLKIRIKDVKKVQKEKRQNLKE